jgi:hypothetical protein
VKGVRRVAIDFDVQLPTMNFRSGAGIAAVLLKAFPLLEEVVLVSGERPVGGGRGERMKRGALSRLWRMWMGRRVCFGLLMPLNWMLLGRFGGGGGMA